MSDEELKELILGSAAETRRYVDASLVEMRQHVDASAAETRREFQATAVRIEGRFDSAVAEMRRHFDVTAEAMRGDVKLVAEAVAVYNEKCDCRTAELEQKIDDAVQGLDRRVRVLEKRSSRS